MFVCFFFFVLLLVVVVAMKAPRDAVVVGYHRPPVWGCSRKLLFSILLLDSQFCGGDETSSFFILVMVFGQKQLMTDW